MFVKGKLWGNSLVPSGGDGDVVKLFKLWTNGGGAVDNQQFSLLEAFLPIAISIAEDEKSEYVGSNATWGYLFNSIGHRP